MIRTAGLLVMASAIWLMTACNSSPQDTPLTAEMDATQIAQHYQAGRDAYQTGDYDRAALIFSQVVSADPEHLDALINWGASLSRGGKPSEAIPRFQAVLARDPNNAAALYNWGVALERMRQHEEALEKYHRAVKLRGDLLTPALERYMRRRTASPPDSAIGTMPTTPETPR